MRRPGLKDDVAYSFFDPEISVLKDMIALIAPDHVGMFREAYGGILKMVPFLATKEEPDVGEISRALYLSQEVIRGGLKEKGNLPGFHLSLLEAKAKEYAALGNWRVVCALIAVSVYGIVLFPN
ncbi:hypothetical protein KIW84_032069 [Lathyrus oleraceus]|uniref:DUF7745 domain-containing protein n=1 Tax=Pisum sativum TaxID=3888 RepID=A0A9D4XTZ0_PEA|nr:hypothetical protein KIW84_032069 [Pisum sativum]